VSLVTGGGRWTLRPLHSLFPYPSHPILWFFQLQKLSASRPVDQGGVSPLEETGDAQHPHRDPLRRQAAQVALVQLCWGQWDSSCAWLGYRWILAEQSPGRGAKTSGKRQGVGRKSKSSCRLFNLFN